MAAWATRRRRVFDNMRCIIPCVCRIRDFRVLTGRVHILFHQILHVPDATRQVGQSLSWLPRKTGKRAWEVRSCRDVLAKRRSVTGHRLILRARLLVRTRTHYWNMPVLATSVSSSISNPVSPSLRPRMSDRAIDAPPARGIWLV